MIYRIEGGAPLYGRVRTQGSKNAALPILFATLVTGGKTELSNLPDITDVSHVLAVLSAMGATVERKKDTVTVDTSAIHPPVGAEEHIRAIRGSSYLLGAGIYCFEEIRMPFPGGCNFGKRPLDIHRDGFSALGAFWEEWEEEILLRRGKLRGAVFRLPYPSVGATVNLVLAALRAQGDTRIEGCADEMHVLDFIRFLRACGAVIQYEGGSLTVKGGLPLHGCRFCVMPDGIEAGTYLIGAAACGGEVTVGPVHRAEIRPLLSCFREMGIEYETAEEEAAVTVRRKRPFQGTQVVCAPYPGFPTDLHPQMSVLLSLSRNGGSLCDLVWRERFGYVGELAKTGMRIRTEENRVFLLPGKLHGARMRAADLRAGAAEIIAALAAEGESVIEGRETVERGYAALTEKWQSLGAKLHPG